MQKKMSNTVTGIQKVTPVAWSAIWRQWFREEGQLKKWRKHFRAEGFSSWGAWRRVSVVAPFGLSRRRWVLYRVTDPRAVVSWSGGPFPRWVAGPYRGAQTRTFGWLASTGRANEERQPTKLKNLPKKIFMFGLLYRGRIVVLDGMHRSVAITQHLRQGRPINSTITIALAKITKLPRLKRSLQ